MPDSVNYLTRAARIRSNAPSPSVARLVVLVVLFVLVFLVRRRVFAILLLILLVAVAGATSDAADKAAAAGSDSSDSGDSSGAVDEGQQPQSSSSSVVARFLRSATCLTTGALDGDELRALPGSSVAGAVLRVTGGRVASWRPGLGSDAALSALARHWHVARDEAEQRALARAGRADEANHEPAGKECACDFRRPCACAPACRLVVLQPGRLREHAREAGDESLRALDDAVASGRALSWAELLAMLGKHSLSLHRAWYEARAPAPEAREGWEGWLLRLPCGGAPASCAQRALTAADAAACAAFVVDEERAIAVLAPRGCEEFDARAHALGVVVGACGCAEADAEACLALLRRMTPGQLKSALQKAVRFGARFVELQGGPPRPRVPARVFAAASLVALFCSPGSFVPDLALFSRGCTSAFKRLGVILFEDAWCDDCSPCPASLFAAALLSARVHTWQVPLELVRWAARVAVACCDSRGALRVPAGPCAKPAGLQEYDDEGAGPARANVASIASAAFLLSLARSFAGDEDLVARAAAAAKSKSLAVVSNDPARFPEAMPVEHVIDQHAFRGVGHLSSPAAGATFAQKFRGLFGGVTGVNARLNTSDASRFEESEPARTWRPAQRLCYALCFGPAPQELPVVPRGDGDDDAVDASAVVGMGALTGAVGPVAVTSRVKGPSGTRRAFVCTLGELEPEDEVVMLRPSRKAADLYASVTPAERDDVVSQLRAMTLRLTGPLRLGSSAAFNAGTGVWEVDGVPWREAREAIVSGRGAAPVPRHPALARGEDPVEAAMRFAGAGVRAGGLQALSELCGSQPTRVLLRALALTRQQHEKVAMPSPALNGGKSASEDAVYSCDPAVYQLLLAASCYFPGALRPASPPHFSVPSPALLRAVERVLRGALDARPVAQPAAGAAGGSWEEFALKATPMQHQSDAVAEMLERDAQVSPHAHFVFMDTGTGKTLTALAYLWELRARGELPDIVLWVVPKPTVVSMIKLLGTSGAPVCELPVAGRGAERRAEPRRFAFNVVAHDSLRTVVDSLCEAADAMAVVVDEADTCYRKTLRTSAAREIAALSRKVLCMTATPMRDTGAEGLAQWLAMCVDFPLTARNWWAAANSMVAKRIDLGIALTEELVRVPLDPGLLPQYRSAVASREWLRAARVVWDALDEHLVRESEKHAGDGVLLVARDAAHAEALLGLLRQRGVAAAGFAEASAGDRSAQVVVVRKDQCRGYNWATRLGSLVLSAYPGNAADRKQMVGRLRRIGQARACVAVRTVVMAGTIVELLHERHSGVDQVNVSLEQLGDTYAKDLLEMIQ
eukprot:m51a1_g1731 hypothetical protein (1311) ;mRNA; f:148396-152416